MQQKLIRHHRVPGMVGRFEYRGLPVLNFVPEGETWEGFPIIVFPERDEAMVEGDIYSFSLIMTLEATYVVDGVIHRVAHARYPTSRKHGDDFDAIVHRSKQNQSNIGRIEGDAADKLRALRERLVAATG